MQPGFQLPNFLILFPAKQSSTSLSLSLTHTHTHSASALIHSLRLPDIFSPGHFAPGHFYPRQSTTRTIFTPDIFSSGHSALGQFATRTICNQDNFLLGQFFTRTIFLPDNILLGQSSYRTDISKGSHPLKSTSTFLTILFRCSNIELRPLCGDFSLRKVLLNYITMQH